MILDICQMRLDILISDVIFADAGLNDGRFCRTALGASTPLRQHDSRVGLDDVLGTWRDYDTKTNVCGFAVFRWVSSNP